METEDIERVLAEAKLVHLMDDELVAYHYNELVGFTLARVKAHLDLCLVCERHSMAFVGRKNLHYELINELAFAEGAAPRLWGHSPSAREINIVVLPPKKINVNDATDFLMLGIVDRVISSLSENSKVGGVRLNVRPLGAVLNARAPLGDTVAVAEELEANRVLRIIGVRHAGQDLSVSACLIAVEGVGNLPGGELDESFRAAPLGSGRLAERELRRLNLKLTKAEQKRLVELQASNQSAGAKYTLGRFYLHRLPGSALEKAKECFADALELDESFAEAHSGLADCYVMEGIYNISPPADSFGAASHHAEKALKLKPGLAEAHTSLAYTYMCYERDWLRAKEEFERALKQNPGYALAYLGLAHLHGALGEFSEAIRKSDRALAIDPVSPMIYVVRAFLFYYAGCRDEAMRPRLRKAREQCILSLRLNRRFDPAWYVRALICVQIALACRVRGRVKEAERLFTEAEDAAKKARDFTRRNAQKQALLGFIYLLWGKEDEALKALEGLDEALAKDSYISPYHMSLVHMAKGQTDEAIECLEKGLFVRDQWMILLQHEPAFKEIHGDKRFKDLIRKLNFPSGSEKASLKDG